MAIFKPNPKQERKQNKTKGSAFFKISQGNFKPVVFLNAPTRRNI